MLVPFNVVRGNTFVRDVQPEDITLVQDGRPRPFTVFEGPGPRRRSQPVEVALLFDTTRLGPEESKYARSMAAWNLGRVYQWTSRWTDEESKKLLTHGTVTVRVSVYRFDHQQLQRLCGMTTDPATLTKAIRALPDAIPAEEAIPLQLPPKRETWAEWRRKRKMEAKEDPAWPASEPTPSWSTEAVIGALHDAFSRPAPAIRLMAVFSPGKGPTTSTAQDAADAAVRLGVPVYPVMLGHFKPPVTLHGSANGDVSRGCASLQGEGICQDVFSIRLKEFGAIGGLTGGRDFYPEGMSEQQVSNILTVIRNEGALQFTVGFSPEASSRAKTHRLEIRLAHGFHGKLRGGKRTAEY